MVCWRCPLETKAPDIVKNGDETSEYMFDISIFKLVEGRDLVLEIKMNLQCCDTMTSMSSPFVEVSLVSQSRRLNVYAIVQAWVS